MISNVCGEGEAGQIGEIFAGVGELVGEGGGVRPEAELVSATTGEGE